MIILLAIWTIGIGVMWIRTHIIMQRRGREYLAGEHKAILELANAMQDQLTDINAEGIKGVRTLNETKLRCRITKDLCGGSIAYTTPLLANGENGYGDSGWGSSGYSLDFVALLEA